MPIKRADGQTDRQTGQSRNVASRRGGRPGRAGDFKIPSEMGLLPPHCSRSPATDNNKLHKPRSCRRGREGLVTVQSMDLNGVQFCSSTERKSERAKDGRKEGRSGRPPLHFKALNRLNRRKKRTNERKNVHSSDFRASIEGNLAAAAATTTTAKCVKLHPARSTIGD